jgi:hypothetical protein
MAVPFNLAAPSTGVGAQAGGFAPTPQDKSDSLIRQLNSQQLLESQLRNDPTTKGLSSLIAQLIAGKNSEKVLNSTVTGQVIRDVSALAIQAAFNPTAQLVTNTQQMMGSQGFRMGGNFAPGTLYGGGVVTDQMSRVMLDNINQSFYSKVSGLPTMAASGLSKPQMADAIGFLSSRGAFSGMRGGEIVEFANHKAVLDALAKARGSGDTAYAKELEQLSVAGAKTGSGGIALKQDKETFNKVNTIIRDFASTLKDTREIFGNLPIGELASAAEKLVGTSISEMGSTSAMRERLANIKGISKAYGLNAEAVASNIMGLSTSLQGAMHAQNASDPRMNTPYRQAMESTAYGRLASSIATDTTFASIQASDSSQTLSRHLGEQGIFMRSFDASQVQQARAGGMMSIMNEKSTKMNVALAASYLVDSGKVSGPAAEEVNKLLGMLGRAGTQEEILKINTEIQRTVNGTGVNLSEVMRNRTPADLLSQMSLTGTEKYQKVLAGNLDSRAVNTLTLMGREDKNSMFNKANKNSPAAKAGFLALATTLSGGAQEDLLGAMNPDGSFDQSKLDKLYTDNPDLHQLMPKEKLMSNVAGMQRAAGAGAGFKDVYRKNLTDFMGNARNAHLVPKQTQMESDKRAMQGYLRSITYGQDVSESDTTNLLRGLFSGKEARVTGSSIFNYLEITKQQDKIGKLGMKDGLISATAEEAANLERVLGKDAAASLYKKLGVKPGDHAALAKALGTKEGLGAIREFSGGLTTKGGFLSVIGKGAADEANAALSGAAYDEYLKKFLSPEDLKGIDTTTAEGRAKAGEKIAAKITAGGGTSPEIKKLMKEAEQGGYGGESFKALALEFNRSPELKNMLTKQEEDLRNKAANESNPNTAAGLRGEADKIKNLKSKLEGDGKDKYVGIFEIASENLAQLRVFLKQGGGQ